MQECQYTNFGTQQHVQAWATVNDFCIFSHNFLLNFWFSFTTYTVNLFYLVSMIFGGK